MVTDSAAHAVCGLDASIFICDQSYGNSRPQSRQTTYVPVTDAAAMLRRSLPRTVMGKLRRWCQQPKTRSNRLISPPRLTRQSMPPAESPPLFQRETVFGWLPAIWVSESMALSAAASPVPTASTKQEQI